MKFDLHRHLRGLSTDNISPDFLLERDLWTPEAFEAVLDMQAAITTALRLAIIMNDLERLEGLEGLYDHYNDLVANLLESWPEDMLPLRLQC